MPGFQSQFVSDALTQRQTYVERVKTALHDEQDAVSTIVLNALVDALKLVPTTTFGDIRKADLQRVVSRVLAKHRIASRIYIERLMATLEDYTAGEALFLTAVVNSALDEEDQETFPVWSGVKAAIIGATGMTIAQTLEAFRNIQKQKIAALLRRAYANNWTISQLLNAFKGTAKLKRKDGLLSKIKNMGAAIVDTVVQFGMSASRFQAMQKFQDWVIGYSWVSILDSATSQTCRSLSGKFFAYGKGPLPPMHHRCRSHIMPVFSPAAKLSPFAKVATDAGESYYKWLTRQPSSFQDDALGKSWGILFRSGGLSAEQFAASVVNARFEPLTLKEFRLKSPDTFTRAGI
jgi:SPP1 gp7 family putative phage head morphogenesis protein